MKCSMLSKAALLGGTFAAVMLWVGSAALGQNLLTNPDLDTTSVTTQTLATPTGWSATANKSVSGPFSDGMSSETFANVLQAGGNGLFFKPFQGTITPTVDKISATLSQSHSATPGQLYIMTGWAGAGAGYIGLTDPTVQSLFSMQFLNGASLPIGSPTTLNLVTAGLGQGSPTPPATGFGYHQYSLSAVAPAGTAFVVVSAQMNNAYGNPAGGDQAFVVDSFSLAVPEPASLAGCSLIGLAALRRRRAR